MKKSLVLAVGAMVAGLSLAGCGSDEPEKSAEDVAAAYCKRLTTLNEATTADELIASLKKVQSSAPKDLQDDWKKVNAALVLANDKSNEAMKEVGLDPAILESAQVSEEDQAKITEIQTQVSQDEKVVAAQEKAKPSIDAISKFSTANCETGAGGTAPAPAPAPSASTPAE